MVIPAFGRPEGLRTTLDALAGDPNPAARVVVVDDGSPDPEALVGAAAAIGATVVRRAANGGPGPARNTGLAGVTSPLVVFLDVDVVPPAGWLDPLLAHFSDPLVAAVAPRVAARASAPGGEGGGLAQFEQDRSPLDLGPAEARVSPRTRVAYVPTTALVVRREALEAVGGFDEALRFGEDVDLVWRLIEAGRVVRYEPTVVVTHPTRPGPAAWLRQRFDYGRSAAPLARRHPDALAPVSVSAWSAAAWALAAVGHPVVGAAVAGTAIVQLPRRLGALPQPWVEGLRLAGGGTWSAWRPLTAATTRAWWPLAVAAAFTSRRARRAVLAAAVIPPLVDWWQGERSVDPLRYVALRLADDLAYGAGVWVGCATAAHDRAAPSRSGVVAGPRPGRRERTLTPVSHPRSVALSGTN